MLRISRELIEELNQNHVQYVYFKSTEHLEDALSGKTDFDFLVSRWDYNIFEKCLLNLNCKRFRPQTGNIYPGVNEWLGFDEETGKLVHLHIHYQIITGAKGFKQYVLPWNELALSTSIIEENSGMRIIHPALELIELYTRMAAKGEWNEKVLSREGTKREVSHLRKQTSPKEVQSFLNQCFFEENSLKAEIFFQEGFSRKDIRVIKKRFLTFLKVNRRSRTFNVIIRSYCYNIKRRIERKLKKNIFCKSIFVMKEPDCGGCVIAFLGADGSGKSTMTQEIKNWLSWKLEVSSMSLGIGRRKKEKKYQIFGKIKSFIYRILYQKKQYTKNIQKEKRTSIDIPLKKTFRSYLRQKSLVNFSKEIRKDLIHLQAYKRSGGIVLLDRYPQLQYRGISDGLKVNASYPRLQKKEYDNLKIFKEIEPDIVFKLNVPLEIAKERRPQDNPDNLKEKIEILNHLRFSKAQVFEIDATQEWKKELLQIKKHIWSYI